MVDTEAEYVLQLDDFLNLPKVRGVADEKSTVEAILRRDTLNVHSELFLFSCVKRWSAGPLVEEAVQVLHDLTGRISPGTFPLSFNSFGLVKFHMKTLLGELRL